MALEDTIHELFYEPLHELRGLLSALEKGDENSMKLLAGFGYEPSEKNIAIAKQDLKNKLDTYASAIGEKYPDRQEIIKTFPPMLDLLALKTLIKEYKNNDVFRNAAAIHYANQQYRAYQTTEVIEKYSYGNLTPNQQAAVINYLKNDGFEGYIRKILTKTAVLKNPNAKNTAKVKSELANLEKELEQTYYGIFGKYDDIADIDQFFINQMKKGNKDVISLFQAAAEVTVRSAYSTIPDAAKIELGKPYAEKQYVSLQNTLEQFKNQLENSQRQQRQ